MLLLRSFFRQTNRIRQTHSRNSAAKLRAYSRASNFSLHSGQSGNLKFYNLRSTLQSDVVKFRWEMAGTMNANFIISCCRSFYWEFSSCAKLELYRKLHVLFMKCDKLETSKSCAADTLNVWKNPFHKNLSHEKLKRKCIESEWYHAKELNVVANKKISWFDCDYLSAIKVNWISLKSKTFPNLRWTKSPRKFPQFNSTLISSEISARDEIYRKRRWGEKLVESQLCLLAAFQERLHVNAACRGCREEKVILSDVSCWRSETWIESVTYVWCVIE